MINQVQFFHVYNVGVFACVKGRTDEYSCIKVINFKEIFGNFQNFREHRIPFSSGLPGS